MISETKCQRGRECQFLRNARQDFPHDINHSSARRTSGSSYPLTGISMLHASQCVVAAGRPICSDLRSKFVHLVQLNCTAAGCITDPAGGTMPVACAAPQPFAVLAAPAVAGRAEQSCVFRVVGPWFVTGDRKTVLPPQADNSNAAGTIVTRRRRIKDSPCPELSRSADPANDDGWPVQRCTN